MAGRSSRTTAWWGRRSPIPAAAGMGRPIATWLGAGEEAASMANAREGVCAVMAPLLWTSLGGQPAVGEPPAILAQAPLGRYTNEALSLFLVAWPAQECAAAAQSLRLALAMP